MIHTTYMTAYIGELLYDDTYHMQQKKGGLCGYMYFLSHINVRKQRNQAKQSQNFPRLNAAFYEMTSNRFKLSLFSKQAKTKMMLFSLFNKHK